MAYYSYKTVVYRKDFQEAITAFEEREKCKCDDDPNYSGDYWHVAALLLDQKDDRIAELEKENAALRAIVPGSGRDS